MFSGLVLYVGEMTHVELLRRAQALCEVHVGDKRLKLKRGTVPRY